MTKTELAAALKLSLTDAELENVEIDIFYGFGLPDFTPVYVTLEQVAKLIRWQCHTFSGGIDAEALNELCHCGRTRFQVLVTEAI